MIPFWVQVMISGSMLESSANCACQTVFASRDSIRRRLGDILVMETGWLRSQACTSQGKSVSLRG
jgi:hypothetical protein